jgi:hypothetical protein
MPSIGGLDGLVRGSERKSNLLLQLLLTLVKLLFFRGWEFLHGKAEKPLDT